MADIFNRIPKYVVSSTLTDVTWNNSHVIKGNIVEEVAKLKEQPGGILLVLGSADLVRLLAQHHFIEILLANGSGEKCEILERKEQVVNWVKSARILR